MHATTLITVLALLLAVLVVPLAAEAQETGKVARIGVLSSGSPPDPFVEAFKQGLRDLGYVEGRNISIEYRWAEGRNERLPGLATQSHTSPLPAHDLAAGSGRERRHVGSTAPRATGRDGLDPTAICMGSVFLNRASEGRGGDCFRSKAPMRKRLALVTYFAAPRTGAFTTTISAIAGNMRSYSKRSFLAPRLHATRWSWRVAAPVLRRTSAVCLVTTIS